MANPEHLHILQQGVEAWNSWRHRNDTIVPDLSNADLSNQYLAKINFRSCNLFGANLSQSVLPDANLNKADIRQGDLRNAILSNARFREAELQGSDLSEAILDDADLQEANLSGAILQKALLHGANLTKAKLIGSDLSNGGFSDSDLGEADLSGATCQSTDFAYSDLSKANLSDANLSLSILAGVRFYWTNLSRANLTDATLIFSTFVESNLEGADLSRSWIYGISVWNSNLKGAAQLDLAITSSHVDDAIITVDNIEIAQFVYLLLHNEKIRDVITTVANKVVLILGRFTPERKLVLDTLRNELRKRDYVPILFDFEKPENRDLTGTVETLARLSRFIIADVTDPRSVPHELATIAPYMRSTPIQMIIQEGTSTYAMAHDLRSYEWVLPLQVYTQKDGLLQDLEEKIIAPAEAKAVELFSKWKPTDAESF